MTKLQKLLADRKIAANDNHPEIDQKDIPVCDVNHWLGYMDRGKGFTGSEPHPYRERPRQIVSRFASVRWPDIKTPPAPVNDNGPSRTGRAPTKHDKKCAGEGLPVEHEIKSGRIAGYLWEVAADVRECYETANAPVITTRWYGHDAGNAVSMERRILAHRACQMMRYRLMHLWRPLIDACVFGKKMGDIGREYGGNSEDAAKLGRQKVIDALIFAREVFWDLRTFAREDAANSMADGPLPTRNTFALGRKAGEIPDFINQAANSNMRSIRAVA
ncbi:hypothetical protein ATN84_01775 [Paramesorhizobium deserti]|uniref:Uncharacterized protein n=2 Tax=Paramesorhizobium deserti TaxID=1494590 RepID=A0A135HZD0_9HYPH|nr:hypothetical protein ATN84_01775 [Paramesorhizobium deserti]